jgi:hypothetical protein
VVGVSDLRAVHIDGFASALERRGMGAIHRHMTVSKIINTLRAIEADRPDRIAPELHERLRYTLATSAGRSTPRDAYSPFVARACATRREPMSKRCSAVSAPTIGPTRVIRPSPPPAPMSKRSSRGRALSSQTSPS